MNNKSNKTDDQLVGDALYYYIQNLQRKANRLMVKEKNNPTIKANKPRITYTGSDEPY